MSPCVLLMDARLRRVTSRKFHLTAADGIRWPATEFFSLPENSCPPAGNTRETRHGMK
jgi:hypothetical protein